ncbi:MAG TPA: hypothetical protein ENN13_01465 [Candidatus Altiarchaeales archaeon]|nr:hypothetical protein [Candidatus Altiarchaeales archaeon]
MVSTTVIGIVLGAVALVIVAILFALGLISTTVAAAIVLGLLVGAIIFSEGALNFTSGFSDVEGDERRIQQDAEHPDYDGGED